MKGTLKALCLSGSLALSFLMTKPVMADDWNKKESLVATVMAVPDYTANTPDKPMIRFEERPSGAPEAIHSWFYPGDNTGWEFIYPKGEQMSSHAAPAKTPAPAPAAM